MTPSKDLHLAILMAQRAVHMTRARFTIQLDYSAESLEQIDDLLLLFPSLLPRGWLMRLVQPTKVARELRQFSIIWGCYLGEVLRQQLGGEWMPFAQSELDVHSFVLCLAGYDGVKIEVMPVQQVYQKLTGIEDQSICAFYDKLQDQIRFQVSEKFD